MSNKFENGLMNAAEGAAIIGAGPQIAKTTIEELGKATGGNINFMPEELKNSGLGRFAEGLFDAAKSVSGPVILAGLVYAGLKKIFENDKEK